MDVLGVLADRDKAAISTTRRDISLTSPIRYVMELMPPEEKPRAVIRIRSRSLQLDEIAAIYHQPGFPAP